MSLSRKVHRPTPQLKWYELNVDDTYQDVVNIPACDPVHPVPQEVKVGAAGPGDDDCVVLAAAPDQLCCQIHKQPCAQHHSVCSSAELPDSCACVYWLQPTLQCSML